MEEKVFGRDDFLGTLEGMCPEDVTEYSVPQGTTCIDCGTFVYCYSLKSVHIPQSVVTISNGAFHCCRSLREIDLPDSVRELGCGVFNGCSSLETVRMMGVGKCFILGLFNRCESLRRVICSEKLAQRLRTVFEGSGIVFGENI